MAIGKTLSSRGRAVGRGWQPALGAAMLAVLFGFGACSPVEAWRDLNGVSKNDPNPATTPNTRNLEAGEASGYPNLATVPPPPTQVLTADELGKLAQSLTADRTNLRSTDQKLRADVAEIAPPAPPPAGSQGMPPVATIRLATATSSTDRAAPAAAAAGPRKAGQPPEPGPMESSLVSPQIRTLPEPEQFQPAPPPPHLAPAPVPAPAARLPPAAPPQLSAASPVPSYQPPTPPPPPPPPPIAMLAPTKTAIEPPAPAISTPIGEIRFAAGATNFSDSAKQTIDEVAARYKRDPAKLRIVGYAAAGGGAAAELNGYRAALDHAQAVAGALTKAGIPVGKIMVEAAPANADHRGRVEIRLEH